MLNRRLSAHVVALATLILLLWSIYLRADEPIDAVWRAQQITFVYAGQTTQYTCGALEDKVKVVLRALGAHEDVVIDRSECSNHTGPRLHVRFKSPVVASVENVRMITTYDAEDRLVARLDGRTLPTAEDLQRFPATWQQVSFARHRKLRMDASDCEFVEHVRRQILPILSAQVATNRVSCTPGFPGISIPRLTVVALIAVEERVVQSD